MAVDEALLKYKGRLGIIQYMPLKPAKRGIKVWMLCTSFLGYVYNFDVYCGKKDSIHRTSHGLGHDVIMHLIEPLKRNYHELYFDRFFTSVAFLKNLLKKNQYGCGTVNIKRRHLPSEIKLTKLIDQGSSVVFQSKEINNLLCTVWRDKKQIAMLSTNADHNICTVKRRNGAKVNEISCPLSFINYNKHMGGVDLADQKRNYYSISRKSLKWFYYLFWFMLDTSVINAFIIMTTSNFPLQKYPMKLKDFKLLLIEELVFRFTSRKRAFAISETFIQHTHK